MAKHEKKAKALAFWVVLASLFAVLIIVLFIFSAIQSATGHG